MLTPLLTTKLYIPPVRRELVPRPRLIERLNAGVRGKLTLISAPPGFGKTTLLSEWVACCSEPARIAWVSLDKGDNDPTRFWAYVILALQGIHDELGESALVALRSAQPPPVETIPTILVNELTALPLTVHPFVLVLDDYHVIESPTIHEGLVALLDHLPPHIRLVIASRADPPWPLARLRSRCEVAEVRADDLRFTLEEATAFLCNVMGLDMSAEDVAALDARTEGWIAGLQMAALSMQGREDTVAFIRAFSGSHHFVLDYLVEEVLDRQPSDVQDFLLQTSILERMTASLCDAVTDGHGSQAILTQLEKANLFLISLDNERRWYRYHHLFADLLQSRLKQGRRDQTNALHRRASEWYERNGLIAEAVSHALAADDVERVARLVELNVLAMLGHGELTTIAQQLDVLPGEAISAHPWLCLARAWVLAYAGQLDSNTSLLHAAEEGLTDLDSDERQRIVGHIAAIRAYAAWIKGEGIRSAELAREALAHLPDQDLTGRALAATTLGLALQYCNDLSAAAPAFQQAVAISQEAGDLHITMLAFSCLAYLLMLQGKLHQARAVCEEGASLAASASRGDRRTPALGSLYATHSTVLRQWNDLDNALSYARRASELAEEWQQADTVHFACTSLAGVLIAVGDMAGALEALQRAKRVARTVSPWFAVISAAQEARLNLAQGDIEAASRVLSAREVDVEVRRGSLSLSSTFACLLIAQKEFGEASRVLADLMPVLEEMGAVPNIIEALVLQSLAQQGLGQAEMALTTLGRALALAEPEGFVRVFIERGAPIGQLLRQSAARGIAADYARKLLAALEAEGQRSRGAEGRASELSPLRPSAPAPLLAEQLSDRELEVLQLLNTPLSTPDIARELVVSTNTVRTHIKSIYGKLNVHSRFEAITRARELKLL